MVTDLQEKVSHAFCDLTFSLLRNSTPSSANYNSTALYHPAQHNDAIPNHIHPSIHIDAIRELGLKFGLLRGRRNVSRNETKPSDTKRLCCPTCGEIVDRFQKSITLDDLLDCFELHGAEETTISSSQYRTLCPALVYGFLVVGGPTSIRADPCDDQSGCHKRHTCCHHHHHHHGHEHHPPDKTIRTVKEGQWKMYVIAIICTGIVCLASMVGIFLFPLLPRNYYNGLTSFMSSLAVGTLAGDALLHLIPHAYGLHSHAGVTSDATSENLTSRVPRCASHCGHEEHSSDYLMKTLVVISGIYLFYLIDVITSKLPGGQDASHHHHHQHNRRYPATKAEDQLSSATSVNKGLHISFNANKARKAIGGAEDELGKASDNHEDFKIATKNNRRSATAIEPSVSDDSEQQPLHTSSRRRSLRTRLHDFFASVRYVQRYAWVVLIADSVHNVSDGVTIGAAFGANMELGLTTTLAVLLHELPHELGDYAILITSGFTHLQALFFNLVTALTAYIGLLVGFLLSSGSEATQQWTLAAAAGIFLYVALVDLFPLLLPSADTSNWDVALHNAGLLLGFVIMFLLAAYEDKIKLPF